MSIMTLTARDRKRLEGVHPRLVEIVEACARITDIRFMVLEGLRTIERQRELVRQKASRTLNSRHLTGHAVDLGVVEAGKLSWHWPQYEHLYGFMMVAAKGCDLSQALVWGGNWPSLRDGPHYELSWAAYPHPTPVPVPVPVAELVPYVAELPL